MIMEVFSGQILVKNFVLLLHKIESCLAGTKYSIIYIRLSTNNLVHWMIAHWRGLLIPLDDFLGSNKHQVLFQAYHTNKLVSVFFFFGLLIRCLKRFVSRKTRGLTSTFWYSVKHGLVYGLHFVICS